MIFLLKDIAYHYINVKNVKVYIKYYNLERNMLYIIHWMN